MDDYLEDLPLESRQPAFVHAFERLNELPAIERALPKIEPIGAKDDSDYPQQIKYNRLFKLLEQKKSRTHIQKNRSLIEQKTKTIQAIKLANMQTSIGKKEKKDHLSHVMPRLYQHLGTNGTQNELPRLRPSSLIPQLQSARVLNDYKVISHVGKGCFSVVSAAVEKNSNKKVAIKTYNRIDQMDDMRIKNIQSQVQNLFNLHHTNVISLKHAVKDGRKIQLIMENGGQQSLSGLLRKTTSFEEGTAKKYFKQMAQALAYCHSQNICHRDIKLQNILVDEKDQVKIIDFGFSLKCNNKARLTSYCGTPPYMSPELAARLPYNGHSSDVWALGVALYLMLTGKFPFKASNEKQLYRLIQQGKYKSENLPPDAKGLLDSMLKVDEKSRMSADQILQSSWLSQ